MSRSTVITETSSSVTGTFALHDLLSITTTSGSIRIMIAPQPASSSKAPAELRLATMSGSIKVMMAPSLHDPSTEIPERIFNSSLESMSGSIDAALIHNGRTSLSTSSGSITASLHPLRHPGSMCHVHVRCLSGSASVTIHPYVDSPQASIRTLSADFRGGSGKLKVRVPFAWEGQVSSDGRVRHEWEGLRVLKDGPGFAAVKGTGLGKLTIWGYSNSVELVGERVPNLPGGAGLRVEGERVPVSAAEMEVKEEGERVPVLPGMPPSLPREVEVQNEGERVPDSPKEEEWQEAEEGDDEDDWTVVGDEDGAQEVVKRHPPSYEDATRT